MAKQIDKDLRQRVEKKIVTVDGKDVIESKVIETNYAFKSRQKANAKYEKNRIKQITVRLPKKVYANADNEKDRIEVDTTEILKDYLEKTNKYSSVNELINDLIEKEVIKELGKNPDELMAEKAKAKGYTEEITSFED